MRDLIRRFRLPLALGLALLGPVPLPDGFLTVASVFALLLPTGGAVGNAQAGVGAGAPLLLVFPAFFWLLYAWVVWLAISVAVEEKR